MCMYIFFQCLHNTHTKVCVFFSFFVLFCIKRNQLCSSVTDVRCGDILNRILHLNRAGCNRRKFASPIKHGK